MTSKKSASSLHDIEERLSTPTHAVHVNTDEDKHKVPSSVSLNPLFSPVAQDESKVRFHADPSVPETETGVSSGTESSSGSSATNHVTLKPQKTPVPDIKPEDVPEETLTREPPTTELQLDNEDPLNEETLEAQERPPETSSLLLNLLTLRPFRSKK